MATAYSHAIVGIGIAQIYTPQRGRWVYWALAGLLAIFPDIDVLSMAAYGAILGHRGITHTLVFALWLGFLTASLTFKPFRGNLWALTAVFFLATASHGLLDAVTRGGEAIPFFWPATQQRYGNWGPIPVADIALELPDPRRSRSIRSEMVWVWAPTVAFIVGVFVWRRVRRGSVVVREGA
jgi:inner membrane protein